MSKNKSKKPAFKEMTESKFKQTGKRSVKSAEQKYLEAVNKQMVRLYEYIPASDNAYISAFHRAMDEIGMKQSYRIVNGQKVPVMRNIPENRAKADELRRRLFDLKAKTMSDIRAEARIELKAAGQKATTQAIQERLAVKAAYSTLNSNLDFVYNYEKQGNFKYSKYPESLRELSRNAEREEYDRRVLEVARAVVAARNDKMKAIKKQLKINPNNVI